MRVARQHVAVALPPAPPLYLSPVFAIIPMRIPGSIFCGRLPLATGIVRRYELTIKVLLTLLFRALVV